MSGSVTNVQQNLPVPPATSVAAGTISGTGDSGLDGTKTPYSFLKDTSDPGAVVPLKGMAQDGADPVGTNAGAQAGSSTVGVGIRGWLSTLAGLFQNGIAKVLVREVANTQLNVGQLSITNTATLIRSATPGRNVVTLRNISGPSGVDFYVGPTSGVTTGTGFPLYAASRDAIDCKWTGAMYGIVASGTATVAYYEEIQ